MMYEYIHKFTKWKEVYIDKIDITELEEYQRSMQASLICPKIKPSWNYLVKK